MAHPNRPKSAFDTILSQENGPDGEARSLFSEHAAAMIRNGLTGIEKMPQLICNGNIGHRVGVWNQPMSFAIYCAEALLVFIVPLLFSLEAKMLQISPQTYLAAELTLLSTCDQAVR